MSRSNPQLHISIGSRYEHIDMVQIAIEDALARHGLDEDACYWTGTAVREGVANAIKHGNRQDPDKVVEIDMAFEEGVVTIRIGDRGEGFNLDEVDDPLAPEVLADLRTSGRGILFMKSFVDTVEVSSRRGGGTMLTLRKQYA